MYWVAPQIMQRRRGNQGVVVALVDRTSSMPDVVFVIERELIKLKSSIPQLRVFGFAYGVKEMLPGDELQYLRCPERDPHTWVPYNNTYLGLSLQQISAINPQKTIIFADGGAADKRTCRSVADTMTGSIDCYFCKPEIYLYKYLDFVCLREKVSREEAFRRLTKNTDVGLLKDLARRSGGRFVEYILSEEMLRAELERSTIDARTVVHHHHHPTRHIEHGEPGRQQVLAAFRKVSG